MNGMSRYGQWCSVSVYCLTLRADSFRPPVEEMKFVVSIVQSHLLTRTLKSDCNVLYLGKAWPVY